MRVLSNSPSGKLILNPPHVLQLIEGSPHKAAALVVRGRDVIVNTGHCCHSDMMRAAGIEEQSYDLRQGNPEDATFRGGINLTGVSFDIWNKDADIAVENCLDALQAAYDFLKSHRKLNDALSLEIAIYDDDYVRTHTFDEHGLTDERLALTL